MENSTNYWMFGPVLIFISITLIGYFSALGLSPEKRKLHIRKFALIGAGMFFIFLTAFKPFIFSYSRDLKESKIERLDSVEKIAEVQTIQSYNIRKLNKDVAELREDLYRMNLYYSTVIQILLTIIGIFCIVFAFKKPESKLEEIDSDQVSKL